MRFQRNSISVNGGKIFYWEKYPTRGPVVLFLHGFPGSHKGLIQLANAFVGYRIIIPDLPACGKSDPMAAGHTLKHYVSWLDAFLVALSIDHMIIVGHSFGARISLQFSIDHPEKVERLALITPVMKVDSFLSKLAALHFKFAGMLPPYLQKSWSNNVIYRDIEHAIIYKSSSRERRKHLINSGKKDAKNIDGRVVVQVFDDFYKHPFIGGDKKIDIKTLFIACDKDEIATLGSVEKLYQRFINAEMRIMKNSGHLVVLERPVATGTIIYKWLKSKGK